MCLAQAAMASIQVPAGYWNYLQPLQPHLAIECGAEAVSGLTRFHIAAAMLHPLQSLETWQILSGEFLSGVVFVQNIWLPFKFKFV